ncbi:MAG: M13 family metallopeptidase [Gammaproteobacteria bacterium]
MSPLLNRRAVLVGTASAVAVGLGVTNFWRTARAAIGKATIGTWGFDIAGMDRSIEPGDDFCHYVGGTWMKTTQIPPDRSRWGSFDTLRAESEGHVRDAVEDAAKGPITAGSPERKAIDHYRAYLDAAAIEAKNLAPARPDLARIAAARTHEDIVAFAAARDTAGNLPIGLFVDTDEKRPDVYVIGVAQSGLGMPDRDYYLKEDARFAEARTKYHTYIETLLTLAAYPAAAASADAIVEVERKIAALHWTRDKSRDRDLTYNPKSGAELRAFAPELPWDASLASFGAPSQDFFVVAQPDAVQGLAKLFRATPVETWRAYMTFHYLDRMADVLPKAFDEARFEFFGRTISGQPDQLERWRRAVGALSGPSMGEASGQLYVKRYFSPQSKEAMRALVENLRAAYRARISQLAWMSKTTKSAALRKLETINVKIGYPDRWRDYTALEIAPDEPFANRKREAAFARARDLERLTKPADRGEWGMSPQTVNAYYRFSWNEIVFPAAILQPPFFDLNADPAVNYGAIGAVIGHEMGHGFDDQGAKSDEHGVLRSWWNADDEHRFQELTSKLADQYQKFEPLPGLFVDGRFTLGENIGDLGGLNVALEAYKISLNGKEPPIIDGFTGVQRFFLGFGQIWRSLIREGQLRRQVVSDPHSPAEFRSNGPVRNMDEWYRAFNVKTMAKLYLPPDQRVRIW